MRPRSDLHNWPTKRPTRPGELSFVPKQLWQDSELRDAGRPVYQYGRSTSVVETWMCERCREWTERGSFKLGACTRCRTPRP